MLLLKRLGPHRTHTVLHIRAQHIVDTFDITHIAATRAIVQKESC